MTLKWTEQSVESGPLRGTLYHAYNSSHMPWILDVEGEGVRLIAYGRQTLFASVQDAREEADRRQLHGAFQWRHEGDEPVSREVQNALNHLSWEEEERWYRQWVGLSTGIINSLRRAHVGDPYDLRERYEAGEVGKYYNIGKQRVREIAVFLGLPAPAEPRSHTPRYWVEQDGKKVGRVFRDNVTAVCRAEDLAAKTGKDVEVICTQCYKHVMAGQSHA